MPNKILSAPFRPKIGRTRLLFNQLARKFERKFKSYFNLSTQQYIIKLRNHEASDLLGNGSQPIRDIAFDLGFYDQSSFTVQFKKTMGMTPLQYRRQFL